MPEIPAEALLAAEIAIRDGAMAVEGWPLPLSGDQMELAARLAVEAAAPFLAAQALNDAAEIAHLTGTDSASGARSPTARATWRMVAKWLRARADLARTEPTKGTNRAT